VSNFILQALTGRDITIYGDGHQTRSFCYCDDLVEALVRLMATGDDITGPINLGNPGEVTIRELAEMIVDLTASRSQIVSRPLPQDDPRQRRPDIARAKSLLGWEPKVGLADGLKATVGYFRNLLQRTPGISALPSREGKKVPSALTMPAAP
jgi:UDP-glucuronate decarboxylase